ncbi:hypothetical protein SLEP1_g3756 [Rubroshorea leprosula]|uniref:Uncharacterized protein n=1 Tax=Rubroshorea leprosula TaxID=152421 RepID=A0AAV5HVC1_9ROSI|nr:hypothetical protein SLEP1_g3756 [Rubroshorea leprosula]
MSGNPTGSARKRSSSSGSQEQHNLNHPQLFTDSGVAPDIQQMIDPLMDYNFAPDHENEGPSSSTGKKGRSRNLKGIRPPKNRGSRKWTLYQWDPADNRHVRNAFLNCMKHRWSDNLKDEKFKWDKNSTYVPCWIPTHIWPPLLTYWDSDEYKRPSARGAKNRSSRERLTHTIRSISFGIHEMQMTESRGGVQPPHQEKFKETHTLKKRILMLRSAQRVMALMLVRGHAWVKAVRGCSFNVMPGIGSQVNPEMQLANMTQAQNNMSQTIAQSVAAALAAHGISP